MNFLSGEFCCGPCPVKAIKEGNLAVKYDAPFVFAEVNADIIHWIVHPDGQRQKVIDLCFDRLSHLLKWKSLEFKKRFDSHIKDKDDYHCGYRSKWTRVPWEGTSAPRVFMATTEKM